MTTLTAHICNVLNVATSPTAEDGPDLSKHGTDQINSSQYHCDPHIALNIFVPLKNMQI